MQVTALVVVQHIHSGLMKFTGAMDVLLLHLAAQSLATAGLRYFEGGFFDLKFTIYFLFSGRVGVRSVP